MKDTLCNLGHPALVEGVYTKVAANPAADVQLLLVPVAAVGAFPDQLAVILHRLDLTVKAAHLAVVALGVQLGIHDVVVDEAHEREHRRDVLLHVGNLYIGDGPTG